MFQKQSDIQLRNNDGVKKFCEDPRQRKNILLIIMEILAFIVNPAIYLCFCVMYFLNYCFFGELCWWALQFSCIFGIWILSSYLYLFTFVFSSRVIVIYLLRSYIFTNINTIPSILRIPKQVKYKNKDTFYHMESYN